MERKRILIAVTQESNVTKLRQQLTASGYEVKLTDNGATALNLSREFKPNLIFADLNLTEVDGHHLLRDVKSNASTKHIPFVMMSEHRSVDERVHTISLGVDDYVIVPFDAQEVRVRFENLLKEVDLQENSFNRMPRGFAGRLHDLGPLEVLLTLEIAKKTGVLHLRGMTEDSQIYIREGEVVDIDTEEADALQGLFRLFTWTDGSFRFVPQEVHKSSRFNRPTAEIIKEGRIYRDRWDSFCKELPPLQTFIRLNEKTASIKVTQIESSVLNVANGQTKMIDLVHKSQVEDLRALQVVSRLYHQGIIQEKPTEEVEASGANGGHTQNNPKSQISRLIGSFLNPVGPRRQQASNLNRAASPDYRAKVRDRGPSHLNRSELLIMREKLSNGKK